jgi:hypothetical protein
MLFSVAAIGMIVTSLSRVASKSRSQLDTVSKLERVRDALTAFTAANGSLPCPANGAADTGLADPATANAICTYPDGTIPWKTLGIQASEALDSWNRKISYRVYAGNTGLTQVGGANMVSCDSQKPGGGAAIGANGLCAADHSNLNEQYLVGKGLTFSDNGVAANGFAFVLISHGPTGYGAWLQGGARMTLPDAGNANERPNTGSAGTYYRAQISDVSVLPGSTNHFDDLLLAISIDELARRSGLAARDWPEDDVELSAETMTDMTTASSDRFNASTAPGGQTLTTTTTTGDDGGAVATLDFASTGAGAYYANCLWWPQSLITYNGTDKFAINVYLEYSTADGARSGDAYDDLGGMVVGFLPWRTTSTYTSIVPGLCGNDTVSTYLGWENFGGDGNLPALRFGIAYDAFMHPQTNDPTPGHFSLVYSGVTHGTAASAPACSASASTYSGTTCYTGPATSWLRDGLTSFHKLRIKVSPRDASCTNAPKLTAWLFPYAVCADAANATLCSQLANLYTDFAPASLPSGAISVSGCINTPDPSDAFDQLYFGITLANRNTGYSGSGMYLRNLSMKSLLVP